MSRAYLSRKLTRPLPTKDGGTLRTVLDARAYMLRLSKDRERSARWQRAAQLSLRRPMSALSAGNSNSRCSMMASSTLGRWHENPDQVHPPERTMRREQKESPRLTSGARTDETSRGRTLDAPILSQGTNQARRGSRKRPDPPISPSTASRP